MHPGIRLTAVVLGVSVAVGAPLAWRVGQPPASVGSPPPVRAASVADPVGEPPTPTSPPTTAAPPTTASPRIPTHPLTEVDVPVRLGIDAIGVDAPLVPVGLDTDRTMQIPDDVAVVGWYEPGVRPGQPGSAVLAGHVDSRAQGSGALFELRRLDEGDRVTIVHRDGVVRAWRVVAREQVRKEELPTERLFVRGGPRARLVLVTCGGPFDRARGHYLDNVVVYAEPA